MKKYVLGKVFISHSSKDKPFVRRLARRLWDEGYQVWLDEKELVPGDALAARLSEALKEARVVIVVVTPASLESRWLKFELNKATERMVKGDCRVIPVLKGDLEPPPELEGMIYADFRQSFGKGFASVLAALNAEAEKAVRGSWAELDVLIEDVFDSRGLAGSVGEYGSDDYRFVCVNGLKAFGETRDAGIIYETVIDYGEERPLSDQWWNEYREAQDRYGELFHLVATERPIFISHLETSSVSPCVKYGLELSEYSAFVVVFADLSQTTDYDERRKIIEAAKTEFIHIGMKHGIYVTPSQ